MNLIILSFILAILLLYILNYFQKQEIKKLHSIIKEIREYIRKASYFQGNKILEEKELLEILDKSEDNYEKNMPNN